MKRFSKFIQESVELDEAAEVSHDRYMRSHGKKASGGHGMWMFTHKRMGDADLNDPKEVHSARGKFSDAKKSAQQWAKKHGHSTVYVMEEVELSEVSTEKLRDYASAALQDKNKAKADKRWKYAGKAMQTVADREVKAAHARKYNKMEEVDLDEAETKFVIKHKKTKQVLSTHDDYSTAKDEHQGLGANKKDYGVYKQTKKDAALRNRNTYREETDLDEKLAAHIVRGDNYIGVPDRVVAQAKDKVKKMNLKRPGEHEKAMNKALSDLGWELTVGGKYVREEAELDENVTKMSHGRLKFHMNNKSVPHGSYSWDQMKAERDRRLKTGQGEAYRKAKMSMSEATIPDGDTVMTKRLQLKRATWIR